MEFTVRPAGREDAAEIARVHIAAWRTTYRGLVPDEVIAERTRWNVRLPLWIERLNGGPSAFVAQDGGAIFGFACACAMPDRPHDNEPLPYDAYLQSIYLLAGRRRHGAGRALLAAVAHDLIAHDRHSLALHVLATNPARAFYERLGAVHVRDEPLEAGMLACTCAYAFPDVTVLIEDDLAR